MTQPARVVSSGEILGYVAEILGVKSQLATPDNSKRTVNRVFRGEQVKPSSLEGLLDALVRAAWDEYGGLDQPPLSDEALERARVVILFWTRAWDQRISRAAMAGSLPPSDDLATAAFLRLLAVDVGVRLGACVALKLLAPAHIEGLYLAARPFSFGATLKMVQRDTNDGRSHAELAEACDVSANAFSDWVTGKVIPTAEHVEKLVRILAGERSKVRDRETLLRALVIPVTMRRLFRRLEKITSEHRAGDLLKGVLAIAKLTNNVLVNPQQGQRIDRLHAVALAFGFDDDQTSRDALRFIAAEAANALGAHDICVIRSDWSTRLGWWSYLLSPAANGTLPIDREQLLSFFPTGPLATNGASPEEVLSRLTLTDLKRIAALQMFSSGGYRQSADLFREVVSAEPKDADNHYNLATALARCADRTHGETLEAIMECEIAAQLCPEDPKPVLEEGVLLIDLERHDEAEKKLRAALQMDSSSSSAAYHLGLVEELRGDVDAALRWYDEAIRLEPSYVDALHNASLLLAAHGRWDDARAYAKLAAGMGHHDALMHLNNTNRR